ncbi:MAG: hypothetical protein E7576_12210, partial [Ruminococcaceae bacterium]|nr:hypothetical protein [Oscillospiraceae bacterium]
SGLRHVIRRGALFSGGHALVPVRHDDHKIALLGGAGDLAVDALGSDGIGGSPDGEQRDGQIARSSEESDLVIVMADWNEGMTSGEQCAAAYYMAEAGADVIVGTGYTVGAVDWLDKNDGTESLVAYSLGNLLSTSPYYENLTGGILTFTAEKRSSGKVAVKDVTLTPTFTHMEKGRSEVQVFPLSSYRDELAKVHYIGGLSADFLTSYVRSVVPAVYLPKEYRG